MTYDFAPLFRTAIGFDRMARLAGAAQETVSQSYPPYNIERVGDDSYRLTMAVAGFAPDDLELTVRENSLVVTGRVKAEAETGEVLFRGIAGRAFERRFVLADHIVVDGADLQNGLLHVGLKRVVPEALKPRRSQSGAQALATRVIANDSQPAANAAYRLSVGGGRACSPALLVSGPSKHVVRGGAMPLLAGNFLFRPGNLAAQLGDVGVQFLQAQRVQRRARKLRFRPWDLVFGQPGSHIAPHHRLLDPRDGTGPYPGFFSPCTAWRHRGCRAAPKDRR